MPTEDYRSTPFTVAAVSDSGRYMGNAVYWKLYTIENLLRVIIHSVLSQFYGENTWWPVAAGPIPVGNTKGRTLDDLVRSIRSDYANHPKSTAPGTHNIYYLFLPDLSTIIFVNISLFRQYIPEIDQWLPRFERIRLPRNIISHMNWLGENDKEVVDRIYSDLTQLTRGLSHSDLGILVP